MKIRNGFVSNSSSSSFIAVGTDDKNIIKRFLKMAELKASQAVDYIWEENEDFAEFNYGIALHLPSGLHMYASYNDIYWVGLDITDLLEKDLRISECKEIVCRKFDNIGIKVLPKKLKFISDTCSSG